MEIPLEALVEDLVGQTKADGLEVQMLMAVNRTGNAPNDRLRMNSTQQVVDCVK
jgi:hypothetical protein